MRKPGKKSSLPPRSPNALWLPRLRAIDFADDGVVKPLKDAGWVVDQFDGIPDEIALACLNNLIREIVADYMSVRAETRRNRVPPAKIRNAVAKLERDVGALIRQLQDEPGSNVSAIDRAKIARNVAKLPCETGSAVERIVVEALNCELDAIDCEHAPDLAFVRAALDALPWAPPDLAVIRVGLDALRTASRHIRIAESGAGPPADRTKITLVCGLARIFNQYTGNIPSPSPKRPFAQFVVAVNDLIPEFQIKAGLDHLIASAANITS
jgi:hypothetical protein